MRAEFWMLNTTTVILESQNSITTIDSHNTDINKQTLTSEPECFVHISRIRTILVKNIPDGCMSLTTELDQW